MDTDSPLFRRRLAYWIGRQVKPIRKPDENGRPAVGWRELEHLAGADRTTLLAFENGERLAPDFDRYLTAYARVGGIDDPRELLDNALREWMLEGFPPVLNEDEANDPQRQAEDVARQQQYRERAAQATERSEEESREDRRTREARKRKPA